jgi:hypothetical protein
MRLIFSILLAFLGTVVGNGVRAAVNLAERQLEHSGPPGTVNINGSLVGGVAAGVVADAVGGPRLGFWLGAVLGAAGADRLDWWILRRVGIDPEKLMARARDAAMAQARARGLGQADEGQATEA